MSEETDNQSDKQNQSKQAKQASTGNKSATGPRHGNKSTASTVNVGVAAALLLGVVGCGLGAYSLYQVLYSKNERVEQLQSNYQHLKQSVHSAQAHRKDQQQQLQDLRQKNQLLLKDVHSLKNRDQQIKAAVNKVLGSYEGKLDVLQQKIDRLHKTYLMPRTELRKQLTLVNVNAALIYVNTADQYIQTIGDYQAALSLLKQAEQVLTMIGPMANQSIAKLRMAISELQSKQNNGFKQEVAKLTQLEQLTTKLELKLPGYQSVSDQKQQVDDSSWKDALESSWSRIRSMITVEDMNPLNRALLDSNVRAQILLTLRFNVEQAKLAMLRGDRFIYKKSMASAHQLVIKYFKQDQQSKQWVELASHIHFPEKASQLQDLKQAMRAVEQLNKSVSQQSQTSDTKVSQQTEKSPETAKGESQ